MSRKVLFILIILSMVAFSSLAQKKYKDHESQHAFKIHQRVYVTLADGAEVEAIIHGHVSKKKYYVRQIGTNKQGKVHEKYIRAMSDSEKAASKEKNKK